MIGNLNSIFKQKIKLGGGAPAYDADAQAYFTANTAITSSADKTAINDFYLGLKSDGVYTKITSMYLPLWSSATANKWNLVNPQDTNGAYRLTFTTGWTHASTGMTPNGTSAYANTFLLGNTFSSNVHVSFYSGTFTVGGTFEMGSSDGSTTTLSNRPGVNSGLGGITPVNYTTTTDARGFWIGSKRSNTDREVYRNGTSQATLATSITNAFPNINIWLGGLNNNNVLAFPSSKQIRFSSIGLGLTDTDASNLSSRVNTLMAYFGINTYPVVSDADAQAYINANEAITSQSDANAINTFFTGLKSDGIYTKIKAMYLPIWGSASASKWNMVNPLDTDAAFRATFTTGWTYSSTGITPNGTSAYMDCKIKSSDLGSTQSMGFYSGTNNTTVSADMGAYSASEYTYIYTNSGATTHDFRIEDSGLTRLTGAMRTDGFICAGRKNTTSTQGYRNGTEIITAVTGLSTLGIKANVIGALNGPTGIALYSNRQIRFGYFWSGTISATEMTNFYNRVQTLMTYFGINV